MHNHATRIWHRCSRVKGNVQDLVVVMLWPLVVSTVHDYVRRRFYAYQDCG